MTPVEYVSIGLISMEFMKSDVDMQRRLGKKTLLTELEPWKPGAMDRKPEQPK